MNHQITIQRHGYKAWVCCGCGWKRLMRDENRRHIPGAIVAAIRHPDRGGDALSDDR